MSVAGLLRVGYFGSYARGDWGVGSDVDIVAVVQRSGEPFERRALEWDLSGLPVPAQLLVFTADEWQSKLAAGGRFGRVLSSETRWLIA